jgi:TetR/AcrR family fatty acid metabolism transcriptional regulator
MARPERRQREIDLRRSDILGAAARVFARKGFAAASMQEIASEAGYGASSLYAYFESKQAIVDGLIESLASASDERFDVVVPAGLTLRQRLELLLHHQFAWIEANRDVVLFLVSPGAAVHASDAVDVRTVTDERLAEWLEQNAEPELLARIGAADAATALGGLSLGFFLQWVREGAEGSPTRYVPVVLDLFLDGFAGVNGGSDA